MIYACVFATAMPLGSMGAKPSRGDASGRRIVRVAPDGGPAQLPIDGADPSADGTPPPTRLVARGDGTFWVASTPNDN
jgi:hypothetical protein